MSLFLIVWTWHQHWPKPSYIGPT